MLEKLRQEAWNKPGILVGIAACFVVILLTQGLKCIAVVSANSHLEEVVQLYDSVKSKDDAFIKRYAEALKNHHKSYLEKLNDNARGFNVIVDAKEKLEQAKTAEHPDTKNQLASEAYNGLKTVDGDRTQRLSYLDTLDQAKKEYAKNVKTLDSKFSEYGGLVSDLKAQGYFSEHFDANSLLLKKARDIHTHALESLGTPLTGSDLQLPDYLAIWYETREGFGYVNEAMKLAQSVPRLAHDNQERIESLSSQLEKTGRLYSPAWAAAQHLSQYPKYNLANQVTNSYALFVSLGSRISEAKQYNDMSVQNFRLAAQVVNEIEGRRAEADRTFVDAIGKWKDLQAALANIPGKENAVAKKISEADEEIHDYSYNNQSEAEGYLRDARALHRDAQNLAKSDPIESLAKYDQAIHKAGQAYEEVDTSSRRSKVRVVFGSGSDDDDDDSGFGGFFGGGGGSDDNSGGGGFFGGGGGSNDSGGGFFGGGDFGGPSGGDFGGPSGGDFGGGDF